MTRRTSVLLFLLVLALSALAEPARAQQRPLTTQEPESIGAGRVLLDAGLEWGHDVFFPASGLKGSLLRVPVFGVSIGISSIADLQVSGGLYNRLTITERQDAPLSSLLDVSGDTTSDVEDLVLATKVRLVGETETRPAFGVRFATRLPNAGNESGIGLDTMDFLATALAGKTVGSTRFVGNLGLGILGDPTRGDRQNDVLLYGASVVRAMTNTIDVVGELNGRLSTRDAAPAGTESRSALRVGARYTWGAGRFDAAVIFGLTTRDPSIGFGVGYTYVFNAFRVP
jgi:hypothetical protein